VTKEMRLAFARQKRKQHITRNNPVKRLDLHLGTEVVEIYPTLWCYSGLTSYDFE